MLTADFIANMMMVRLLVSSVYSKSRTFQCSMACQGGETQKCGRKQGWARCPELAKGQFHTIECHASGWAGEITWKQEADGGSETSLALGSRGWAIVLSLVLLGF